MGNQYQLRDDQLRLGFDLKDRFRIQKIVHRAGVPVVLFPNRQGPIVRQEVGRNLLDEGRWGPVPHWSKDPDAVKGIVNASCETLTQKPSFRNAFTRRHCILPASDFFEWHHNEDGTKTLYRLWRQDGDAPGGDKAQRC